MIVAGGKYTTYRVMAADVIDRVVRRVASSGAAGPASVTDKLPLLGADGFAGMWTNRADIARRRGVTAGRLEHLLERYGSLTTEVLDLIDADPIVGPRRWPALRNTWPPRSSTRASPRVRCTSTTC